jgi:ATP:cob(I)alamin adenosyltransferase
LKKAYTKAGDSGRTKDCSGRSLAKDDVRIVAGGKIDALQSAMDLALRGARGAAKAILRKIQGKLWAEVGPQDLANIERFIDGLGEPPRKFVRFGSLQAIRYNECRVRCRDLESACTPLLRARKLRPAVYAYLNRLSSLFFMLAYRESRRKS